MIVSIFWCIILFIIPAINFHLTDIIRAGVKYIKARLYPCVFIKCHPAKLCIDTVYNLHSLPGIIQDVYTAISTLIFIPLLHCCLICVIEEYIPCQSPFFFVSVEKITIDPDYAADLKLNESSLVNIEEAGTEMYFSITPEKSGIYTLASVGDEDTCGYLYDSEGYRLAYSDDDGEDFNFSITYALEAGKIYYLAASFLDSDDTGTFSITLLLNEETTCNHTWDSGVVTKAAT